MVALSQMTGKTETPIQMMEGYTVNCKPYIGAIYGRLCVTLIDGKFACCRCACGQSDGFKCRVANLKNGTTKSCGCLRREAGLRNKTHGMTGTSLYSSWLEMRDRCYSPKNKSFSDYGARGISVCERWISSFENFRSDMGDRPSKAHTIDRIDNDGDYSPENCRWATKTEQTRNRSCAILVDVDGEKEPLIEVCKRYGASYSTVHSRLFKHGWPLRDALTLPKNSRLKRPQIRDQDGPDEMIRIAGLPHKEHA